MEIYLQKNIQHGNTQASLKTFTSRLCRYAEKEIMLHMIPVYLFWYQKWFLKVWKHWSILQSTTEELKANLMWLPALSGKWKSCCELKLHLMWHLEPRNVVPPNRESAKLHKINVPSNLHRSGLFKGPMFDLLASDTKEAYWKRLSLFTSGTTLYPQIPHLYHY